MPLAPSRFRALLALSVAASLVFGGGIRLHADAVAQTLPFAQNWSNTGLITTNDIWTGVPGIEGYRGDGLTGGTAVLAADDPGVLDVNANQTAPNTFTTGGVTEFHLVDPVVALAGSGTARAPYLRLTLNTSGLNTITGQGGAITVAHDGRYGELAGKTVALEPSTGFSFDTKLTFRER